VRKVEGILLNHLIIPRKATLTLLKYLCILAFCCLLTACDVNLGQPTSSANGVQCQSNCSVGTGANGLGIIVEPDAGPNPLVDAIRGAKKSVDLEMYLLTNNFLYFTQRS